MKRTEHFNKILENKKKEEKLREELQNSILMPLDGETDEKQTSWEIDISDLEFSIKLGVGTSGEVFKGNKNEKNGMGGDEKLSLLQGYYIVLILFRPMER